MELAKNTLRATVQIGYDGQVYKTYRGPKAEERFANEIKILQYLEEQGCPFVPKLLSFNQDQLQIVMSYCGTRVERLDDERTAELFTELESYGVHHDDEALRNVTYRQLDGRFCLIDFEFATILANHKPRHDHTQKTSLAGGLRWSAHSDRGRVREFNEDSFLGIQFDRREVQYLGKFGNAPARTQDFVFAVSDGIGGATSGSYATWVTSEKILQFLPKSFKLSGCGIEAGCTDVLEELFNQIHQSLARVGGCYDECADMQTTLSLCWFAPGWMYFGHTGSSRIYYLPVGQTEIRQLSQDTVQGSLLSAQNEQAFTSEQAIKANTPFTQPQVGAVSCQKGDRFLLCTDGLSNTLNSFELSNWLQMNPLDGDSDQAAKQLVSQAVNLSGQDNTTAIIVEIT